MLYIKKSSSQPLYMQIYKQLQAEILQGTLKEGDLLSGSRMLAQTLHVSRNTVDNAYSQLAAEGYIVSKPGIGFVVAKLPSLDFPYKSNSADKYQNHRKCHTCNSKNTGKKDSVRYDLTNSSHTSNLFPKNLWKRYTLECLEQLEREEKLSSLLDPQGEAYLRHSLRLYLERIRGVHCHTQQIIITCGIQQSLDIICKLLPSDLSTVLMEEPGYNKAGTVFQNNGKIVETIPVDEYGICTSKLPSRKKACAVYTTPSHQFPTGVTLPISRRYELLKWAANSNTFIIEDDYDSELRYYAKPIPSLQSIDTTSRVIYLGTFSKMLSPSIRMGYMILPPQLYDIYQEKFKNYNSSTPLLNQYVVAKLLESGEYDRRSRRLNLVFRKRLELFSTEIRQKIPTVKISGNGSGQYFLLEFPTYTKADTNTEALISAALKQGVRVYSTMQFWQEKIDCPPNTLFLGFSKIDLKDIPDCVNRLSLAWNPLLTP